MPRASAIRRILLQTGDEPEGRRRDRRTALGAISLVGARGMGLVLTLVTVPLTLPYLGPERFGLWMTINSVVALVSFADLGLGNGVMTLVAEDEGRDDTEAAAVHSSSAFFAMAAVSAALALSFAAIHPVVPWAELFNVSSDQAAREAGDAAAVAVACFLMLIPLSVVRNVQLGYQDGLRRGIWDATGSLLSLVGTVVVVVAGGSLPLLVAAFAGGPVLASLGNSIHWFIGVRPELRPRPSLFRRAVATELVRVGSVYMLLQLAAMVAFFSDALILARILGPEATAEYSVAWKLFSVVSLTVSLALMPLWPAYSEAAARRDARWVRETFRRSLRLTLFATVPASALLLALGGPIIDLWSASEVDPPFGLLAALAAWTVIYCVGVALAMFMNALKIVRLQLIVAAAMAITNVALSVVLTHAIGITGVILGTLVSYTLVALVPLSLAVPRILAGVDRQALGVKRDAPSPPTPALPAPEA